MPQFVNKVQPDGTVHRYPADPEAKILVEQRGYKDLGYIPIKNIDQPQVVVVGQPAVPTGVAVHPSGHPATEKPVYNIAPDQQKQPEKKEDAPKVETPSGEPYSSAKPRRGRPPKNLQTA